MIGYTPENFGDRFEINRILEGSDGQFLDEKLLFFRFLFFGILRVTAAYQFPIASLQSDALKNIREDKEDKRGFRYGYSYTAKYFDMACPTTNCHIN